MERITTTETKSMKITNPTIEDLTKIIKNLNTKNNLSNNLSNNPKSNR